MSDNHWAKKQSRPLTASSYQGYYSDKSLLMTFYLFPFGSSYPKYEVPVIHRNRCETAARQRQRSVSLTIGAVPDCGQSHTACTWNRRDIAQVPEAWRGLWRVLELSLNRKGIAPRKCLLWARQLRSDSYRKNQA